MNAKRPPRDAGDAAEKTADRSDRSQCIAERDVLVAERAWTYARRWSDRVRSRRGWEREYVKAGVA